MVPPHLDAVYLDDLPDVNEQALWPDRSLKQFKARYRLTVMGIVCRSYLVRIDQKVAGDGIATVKSWNRCKRDTPYEERAVYLTTAKMAEFDAIAKRARLWETAQQFWRMDDDAICVDGEEMIFERRDISGYRVAQANAQCEAPGAVVLAARTIFELVHERGGLDLLPEVMSSDD